MIGGNPEAVFVGAQLAQAQGLGMDDQPSEDSFSCRS